MREFMLAGTIGIPVFKLFVRFVRAVGKDFVYAIDKQSLPQAG
jgi:hypothetical protein